VELLGSVGKNSILIEITVGHCWKSLFCTSYGSAATVFRWGGKFIII